MSDAIAGGVSSQLTGLVQEWRGASKEVRILTEDTRSLRPVAQQWSGCVSEFFLVQPANWMNVNHSGHTILRRNVMAGDVHTCAVLVAVNLAGKAFNGQTIASSVQAGGDEDSDDEENFVDAVERACSLRGLSRLKGSILQLPLLFNTTKITFMQPCFDSVMLAERVRQS